jgi:hypothetical protein
MRDSAPCVICNKEGLSEEEAKEQAARVELGHSGAAGEAVSSHACSALQKCAHLRAVYHPVTNASKMRQNSK